MDIQKNLFLNNDNFLWISDKSGFDHIYLVEDEGKRLNQITKGNWDVAKLVNESTVYYSSTEDNSIERVIYSISLNGKNKKAISRKRF